MAPTLDQRHIRKAYLTSLKEGVIELTRDWKAMRTPPISVEGRLHGYLSLFPLPPTEYCRQSGYYVDEAGSVVFAFFPERYSDSDYKGCSIYLAGAFNGWQSAVGKSEWELAPDRIGGRRAYTLRVNPQEHRIEDGALFKFVTDRHHWFGPGPDAPNIVKDGLGNWNYIYHSTVTGKHRLGFVLKDPIDLSENHFLLYHTRKDVERVDLQPGEFFFNLKTSQALGAVVEKGRVTFRLFAPRAKWVKVGFFQSLDDPNRVSWILMRRGPDFVWEAVVEQDLVGWYYWYRLDGPTNAFSHFDPTFKVLDPYAKATVGREGPGIVVDDSVYAAPKRFLSPQWQDLVVMEAHVRDLTQRVAGLGGDDGEPRGFRELAAYARREDFYPKRVGVNAIELQPIQENDSLSYDEYHWGYMTNNYFAPHSGYAANPQAGSQVADFRDLVATLHEEGFAVLLDVVYNHVGEPAHLLFIDKLYYFHQDEGGRMSNWSGCGNDLRCETPMGRRLIIDSLKHLVQFYGVDGFRFDLADLIGKPVLQEIERELKAIKPEVILIAEPWSFRGHIGPELRDTGFASWNDGYREQLKRFVRAESSVEGMKFFLRGSPIHYASWPAQTVNYVESHDDRVWIDDITENGGFNGEQPTATDVARSRLMIATLMMSIGMPMVHAGMDFLTSKGGVRNTYKDGPRNALDYRRALRYPAFATYFADWIAFRLSAKGSLLRHFSRADEDFYSFHESGNGVSFACVYNASGRRGGHRLLFAVNPSFVDVEIDLGDWGSQPWRQIADHERFLKGASQLWANAPDKALFLPPLACGLWELDTGD